jgi:hypothetical protein
MNKHLLVLAQIWVADDRIASVGIGAAVRNRPERFETFSRAQMGYGGYYRSDIVRRIQSAK